MSLIVSIVNATDAGPLVDVLVQHGYRATTISTTGGFLRQGNATILIGAQDKEVDAVLSLIQENCHMREEFVNPLPPVMEPGEMYLPTPVEVQVGGATVFVLDVERSERF